VKKMKHRSTHIFILLAAMLVAAPQVSQELSAFKNAASRHVKAAIINAFLNLQAGATTRPAPAVADSLLASCATASEPAARKVAAPSRPATQVEVHARREVPADAPEEVPGDLAMLTDPAFELASVQADVVPATAVRFDLHDLKGVRGRELAMLTPPDVEVAVARAAARREANETRRAAARRRKVEQAKQEAASVAWRFANADESEAAPQMDVRDRLELLRQFDVELRQLTPPPPARSLKAKPPARPAAAAPPARVACPTRQLACGPSGPETIFVGE
jgi:hypothetical protein